jgi:Ca2+-binding RTX toxin-like protein
VARRKRNSRGPLGLFAGAAVAALLAFPGVASAKVTSTVNAAGALTVMTDAGDPVRITSDANGKVKINDKDPDSGAATAASIKSIQVTGDGADNVIDLSGVSDPAFGLQTTVKVNGGGGNDTITGSKLADVLEGGDGNDGITADDNPQFTRDVVRGDAGDDTMVWNGGDDDDDNDGGAGNDTTTVNGADGFGEQFTVKPSQVLPGGARFDRTGPTPPGIFNIEISAATERLDLNGNGGDDTVTADEGFSNLKLDVEGGEGNDTLDGGDAADLLSGGGGNDSLTGDNNPANTQDDARGDAGDDTMIWNPGDGDDINEGGEGNDTTEVNGGGGPEDFEVAPAAAPGRVLFQRTGPTPPGPFDIDIGTTENLRLNAGDGDDKIKGKKGLAGLIDSTFNGDAGNDRIKGTDGEDLLTGGKGFDVINSRDNAADQVEGDDGFDIAFVDSRDTVRAVEIVLGGSLKVKATAKSVNVAGGVAALTLRCVDTERCRGVVVLRHDGKKIARANFKMGKKKTRTVRLKLNKRGLRLLAKAPNKGLKVQLRIDAKDAKKNGWRTNTRLQLKP